MDIEGRIYCSKCMRKIEEETVCPFCHFDHRQKRNESPALEIGSFLNNRYQLGSVIGQGGFGITYAAWDEVLDIPVAVKEYFPSDIAMRNTEYSDEVAVAANNRQHYLIGMQHFLRESRVLAMMKGLKGVVEVQDYFEENETAYIVMEFIHGIALDQYVKQQKVSAQTVLEMIKDPVDALIRLHKQGVLHRDITPSNFLVQEDGTVKLIDFGSATKMQKDQSMIVVTESYAPIEQYQSKDSRLGAWTDVYGLAATLYHILTGIVPQESVLRAHKDALMPIDQTNIRLKSYQCKAIMQGLAVAPDKRIQSMEEFRSRLYNLPLPEEVLMRKKFMRKVIGISGVVLLLILGFIVNATTGLPMGKGLWSSLHLDGWHVIKQRSDVESLVIPESFMGIDVTAIEAYAFSGCEVLREVVLPENLDFLDAAALEGTSDYLTVWVSKDSAAEEAVQQAGIYYDFKEDYEFEETESDTIRLVSYNETKNTIRVPSMIDGKEVTEYAEYLFEEIPVEEIVFSDHLRVIGTGAFAATAISEMEIPDTVEVLGEVAFAHSAVKQVTVPSSVKEIGSGAFANCAQLENIVLPETLTVISDSMFRNSDALQHIKIPDSVMTIEASAFELCDSLEYLVLPEGLTTIGNLAFADCYNLKYIDIPESVTQIGEDVFLDCSRDLVIGGYAGSVAEEYASVNGIRFDDKSKWIEEVEFTYPGCVKVSWGNYKEHTILPTYDYVHDTLVHTVDDTAMSQTEVKTLRLPLFAEKIGWIAFKESYRLKEIEIFDTVKVIYKEAFLMCENLEHVYIYGMYTTIDDKAFDGCDKLTIHGYRGSSAESYAKNKGIPFENIE